jgi:RNA polymerase sigma-54 factor
MSTITLTQSLTQTQRLIQKLSPQQIQYLRILQQPLLSLEQCIKQELEINPVLEEGEDEVELAEQIEAQGESDEQQDEEQKIEDYPLDDPFDDESEGYKTRENNDDDFSEPPIEDFIPISAKLLAQLHFLALTPEEDFFAQEVIGNLDDDGYFRLDVNEFIMHLPFPFSYEDAENVLKKIQQLDPPGLASRNLRECLIAQLIADPDNEHPEKKLALAILTTHFDDFVNRRFKTILSHFHINIEKFKQVEKVVHKLNPKPGEGSSPNENLAIVPDFIVKQDDDEGIIVELTNSSLPIIRINKAYKEMIQKKSNNLSPETREFIKNRIDAAKVFLQSIQQRHVTLLKIMRAVIERQPEFFETGEHLRPLTNRDIGEIVSLDDSTVSRAVHGKYVQTPFGVYPLKYFFSTKVQQSDGEEISNKEAKLRIKKIIDAEDKKHPLSDEEITHIVNTQGLPIARRTVAKYRELLEIPIARLRKTID